MPELEILQKKGLTVERLKELFTTDKPTPGIVELRKRIESRIIDGRTFSFMHWQLWQSIDALVETPFRQANTAVLMNLATKDPTSKDVLNAAEQWGLTHMITKRKDPKNGKEITYVDIPKFFSVFVPLARAFSLVRAAKLTIDRIQVPLFKWEPVHDTPELRRKCEILTSRVEMMADQFGYRHQLQQAIRKAVEYGQQLQFVQEDWWDERQLDGNDVEIVVREGVRYKLPHPSWTYYDQNNPPAKFNTDTGPEFAGYWMVKRYGEVSGNKKLWNVNKIAFSKQTFTDSRASAFFQQNGCVMTGINFKTPDWSNIQRESETSHLYTSNHMDNPVLVSHHFDRIIPSEFGLADYDYPVWMWFIVASDSSILYAAPLPHCPVTYWGYDTDDTRLFNASMVLETAPWEVAISNLFTQYILSIKSNLANLTFLNSDIVDEKTRQTIENLGQRYYTGLNFVEVSGKDLRREQNTVANAVFPVQFPKQDVSSIMTAVQNCVGLMERSLVMSAQEVGSYASHEQSAEEMRVISQSTSVRLAYTGLGIDNAIYAMKQQLYAYLMAYGKSEFYAYVEPGDTKREELEALGFTVDEGGGTKWRISAPKSALKMEAFSSVRDGQDRTNSVAIGTQMVQLLAPLAPKLVEAVSPQQVLDLFNRTLDIFGLPRDWRVKPTETSPIGPDGQENPNAPASKEFVVQQIQMVAQKIMEGEQQQAQASQQAVQQLAQSVQQELQPIAGVIQAIQQIAKVSTQNSASISDLSTHLAQIEQLIGLNAPPQAQPIQEAAPLPGEASGVDPMAQPPVMPVVPPAPLG
jgi:hypothetical protein